MKKLIILLVALTLAVASTALAIVDPDPDMMGMYFDMDADQPCVDGAAAYSNQTLYLAITNPSFDLFFGLEAGYDLVGEGMILSTFFPPEWLPLDVIGIPGNHMVGFGLPAETTPVTIVATISVIYMSTAGEPLNFMLHGADPGSVPGDLPVVYLEDGVLMQLGLSAADGMVAQVNGGCQVVATEELSFDSIKSLYR